ncbi:MAG: hypothetical protein IJF25_04400 [Oscillospiraceae bacterium]|nr:hypothetical protein [Oscillospiraceae bacterium]MBQ4539352.1 hypothetical protein [Oscillospiraceae bacterium]
MACRCCGSIQNNAVVSYSGNQNNANGCYWPSFANLPRSGGTPCCNNNAAVYNNRYTESSGNNDNGCGCRRCRG